MRRRFVFLAFLGTLLLGAPAHGLLLSAVPDQVFAGPGSQVSVDVVADVASIQFDLHVRWDVDYWTLSSIQGAGTVERDDTRGVIDDLFADVGTGDPIAAGAPLFTLHFDVVGDPSPRRVVLEVGNLSTFPDPIFDPARSVLLADPDFNVLIPASDRSENALVLTPEPSTFGLLALGLISVAGPARRARRPGAA